jgi:hypothetical protein
MRPPLDAGSARAGALCVVIVALAGGGCDEKKSADADAGASVDASADAGTRTGLDAGVVEAGQAGHAHAGGNVPLPICRVMASENGPSANADATGWLDIAAQASFTVRTLETGRELRFEGPGRVRACADDVALVATGSAIGLPGSGEAPGAEQWVATPCGVARWASGVHRFTGARDACKLQSSLGSLWLYVAPDVIAAEVAVDGGAPIEAGAGADAGASGKPSPWRRLDGRRAFALQPRSGALGAAGVKAAIGACEHAADAVQKVAAAMMPGARAADGGPPSPTVGDLAEESVVARGVARAACAVAAVRLAVAGSSPVDEARLAAASIRWRGSH